MPITWKISHEGGSAASLESLKVETARLSRRSLASDSLVLTFGGESITYAGATPAWSEDDAIELIRDDGVSPVTYFKGFVTQTPRTATSAAQRRQIVVSGPWEHLETLVYQQSYASFGQTEDDPPVLDLQVKRKSRLTLCQNSSGTNIATGAEIGNVLTFALAASPPVAFAAGTILTGFFVHQFELQDVTCADAIRALLRWHPDAVSWFDYSAATPSLNIVQRSSLSAVSLSASGKPISECEIYPRYDLQPPCIAIHYERTNELDGQQYSEIIDDIYPDTEDDNQRKAVVVTVPLKGTRATLQRQPIVTRPYPPSHDDESYDPADALTFWQGVIGGGVAGLSTDDIEVVDGTHTVELDDAENDDGTAADDPKATVATEIAELPRILVSGAVQKWMQGVIYGPIRASAQLRWKGAGNPTGIAAKLFGPNGKKNCPVQGTFTGTDAVTKEYTGLGGVEIGESAPTGIAQAVYNQLSTLQYEGTWTLKEAECGDTEARFIGKKLNITGGVAGWATMGATISGQDEDLRQGLTDIYFGPARHLTVQDFIELCRVERESPVVYRSAKERAQAAAGDEAQGVDGALANPRINASASTDPGFLQPLEGAVRGAAGAWKVWVEPGWVLGWDGTIASALLEATDAGTEFDIAGDHDFAVKIDLSWAEGEPYYTVDLATVTKYNTGAIPASSVDGASGTIYIKLFTVTGGAGSTEPVIDPEWIGNITCLEPAPPADTGSVSSSSSDPGIRQLTFESCEGSTVYILSFGKIPGMDFWGALDPATQTLVLGDCASSSTPI